MTSKPPIPSPIAQLIARFGDRHTSSKATVEAVTFKEGDQLHFNPRFQKFPDLGADKSSVVSLLDPNFFQGTLASLAFHIDNFITIVGSAVIVAPGIALTAAHTATDFDSELKAGVAFPFLMSLGAHMQCWSCSAISLVEGTDLATLSLTPLTALPPDGRLFTQAMTTRLPVAGERLFLAGFRSTEAPTRKHRLSEFSAALVATSGLVTKQYPQGRDSFLMPWPCVEVSTVAWGGMSGGPVFDIFGRLIGLVCSCVEAGDDGGPSFVSLLWPAMAQLVHPTWLVEEGDPTSLLRYWGASVDKPEALCLYSDIESRQQRYELEPWS
jgi:Trypsin-like peptidase domain